MPVSTSGAAQRAPHWLPRAAAWSAVAAIVLHLAVFIERAANPLIISDSWYFVDTFLRKYVEDEVGLADFFARRAIDDHALPFHKLLLLINYRLFDLDLSMDAWIGFAFALASVMLLRETIRRSMASPAFAGWPVQAAWVAIAAIFLSVNSTQIFEWPLLTLTFVALFSCLLLFALAWRGATSGRWMPVLPALLAALLIADDGAVAAVIATVLTLALLCVRGGCRIPIAVRIAIGLCAVCIAYKLGLRLVAPLAQAGAPPVSSTSLLARWPQFLPVATEPFSGGLLHGEAARVVLHRFATPLVPALGWLLVATHGVFWWQALRRTTGVAWFVAVALILLFYGLCAGMVLGRGGQYGPTVFDQPRYVIFYELHVVALLLMAACWLGDTVRAPHPAPLLRALLGATCVALVLLQIPIDQAAWLRVPYERRYVDQLAIQMDQLAAVPGQAPPGCYPQLTICAGPPARRARLVVFLRDHHLNLYSPAFRRRHGFEAD